MSTREELQRFAKRRYSTVTVDGITVRLQRLTELERSNLQSLWGKRFRDHEEKGKDIDYFLMRRELLVACIVDDEGNRLFKMDELDVLGEWDPDIIDKIHEAAQKLNPVGSEDVETVGKKSEETTDSV
jgi:hypothetical protein